MYRSSSTRSVLIVDDDREGRELLATILGQRYRCATAASAEEATHRLAVARFDVVITDLEMPSASGIDLCYHVKKTSPSTAVVVMSGTTDTQTRLEAISSGAVGFLAKPLDLARLDSLLEGILLPPCS